LTIWNGAKWLFRQYDLQIFMVIATRRGVKDQFRLKQAKVGIRYEREYGACGTGRVAKALACVVEAIRWPSPLRAELQWHGSFEFAAVVCPKFYSEGTGRTFEVHDDVVAQFKYRAGR
jgi:hypothetical protein